MREKTDIFENATWGSRVARISEWHPPQTLPSDSIDVHLCDDSFALDVRHVVREA